MIEEKILPSFWRGKKVFLTGHTGFKGGWLSLWLADMGAQVTGFALQPNTNPSLYDVCDVGKQIHRSIIGDIRELDAVCSAMESANPDIVIHMAAQPLVQHSYKYPVETYAINVMGTVHVLEAMRRFTSIRAAIIVTTDKCYENQGQLTAFSETDPLGGYDPYSSSKGSAELVVSAYERSFFSALKEPGKHLALASVRAGNVIGGGDWSQDRLIPDAIKAIESNTELMIRNPQAVRPWQHVLEPLAGYLILVQKLFIQGNKFNGGWNFGPSDADARSVGEVINLLMSKWPSTLAWSTTDAGMPYEAKFLKLNCEKAHMNLNWHPKWNLTRAIENIVDWHKSFHRGENMLEVTLSQIAVYQQS